MITYEDSTGRPIIVVMEYKDRAKRPHIRMKNLKPRHFQTFTLDLMVKCDLFLYQDRDGVLKIFKCRNSKNLAQEILHKFPLASMLERVLSNQENLPILMGMDKELDSLISESLKQRWG